MQTEQSAYGLVQLMHEPPAYAIKAQTSEKHSLQFSQLRCLAQSDTLYILITTKNKARLAFVLCTWI